MSGGEPQISLTCSGLKGEQAHHTHNCTEQEGK
jgi:hypothetical protein